MTIFGNGRPGRAAAVASIKRQQSTRTMSERGELNQARRPEESSTTVHQVLGAVAVCRHQRFCRAAYPVGGVPGETTPVVAPCWQDRSGAGVREFAL